MAGLEDYYKFLGVNPNATQAEIKKAWKRFSKKNHPDKHANKGEAEEKKYQSIFQEGQNIYNTLKDETKRARYHRQWNANFNFGTGKNNEYNSYTNTRSNNTGKKSNQTYNHYSNQKKKQQTGNTNTAADDKAKEEAKREKAKARREYWNKKSKDFKKDFKTYSSKAGKQTAKEWSYFWEATKQGGKKTKEGFSSVKDDIKDLYSKFKNYKQRKKTENRNNFGNTNDTNYKSEKKHSNMNTQTETTYSFATNFAKTYKGDPSMMAFDPKFTTGINAAYKAEQAAKSRKQKELLEELKSKRNPKPTEEENEGKAKKASLEKRINITGSIAIPAAAILGAYIGFETHGEIFQYIGNLAQTGLTHIANYSPDLISNYFDAISKVTIPDYVNKAADVFGSMGTFAAGAYGLVRMKAESVAEKYKNLKLKTHFN